MILAPIPREEIPEIWHHAEPFIFDAVKRSSGRHSVKTVRDALDDERMQLWMMIEGGEAYAVVVTELITYATGLKACSGVIVTGRERDKWLHLFEPIKNWARQNGCELIEAWARPGWQRVLGWRETHRLIEERL